MGKKGRRGSGDSRGFTLSGRADGPSHTERGLGFVGKRTNRHHLHLVLTRSLAAVTLEQLARPGCTLRFGEFRGEGDGLRVFVSITGEVDEVLDGGIASGKAGVGRTGGCGTSDWNAQIGTGSAKEVRVGVNEGEGGFRDFFDGGIDVGWTFDFDGDRTGSLKCQLWLERQTTRLTLDGANFSKRESIVMVGASSLRSSDGRYLDS